MTNKLHKPYDALLRSIDFFSQNLHLEQITQYGFRLFEDLIQPDQAVLYLKDHDKFIATHFSGYDLSMPEIPYTKSHNDFAVFSGFILEHRSAMERFFKSEILDILNVEYIMPLISGNQLMGFIFYNGSSMEPKPDIAFMTRFNHMLNLSLEKACRFLEQKKMKDEIDKRLFNLASLSQTTKLLLSELETDKIYSLCIDVIRELTSSSITSFSTLDPVTGHLITRAYQNIITFESRLFQLQLRNANAMPSKVIYDVQLDFNELEGLFLNPQEFREMKAKYVVLLVKDSIIGCITIGEPVGAINYDKSLLEQIENVAGIVHLSLTNAQQFEQILEQKEFMERQADLLKKINKSVKTINSAESLDELCQVSMDTLQYAFGVEAGFIATFSNSMIQIQAPLGFNLNDLEPICQDQMKLQMNDDLYVSYIKPDLDDYFCESLSGRLPDPNCLVIAPIRTSGWQTEPLGCIAVLRMSSALREEHTVLIDSLANSIAPVVKQFYQIEDMQRSHIVDPESRLKDLYERYEHDRQEYGIDFTVMMKYSERIPYTSSNDCEYEGIDSIRVHNAVLFFTATELEEVSHDLAIIPESFDDVVHALQDIHERVPRMEAIEKLR